MIVDFLTMKQQSPEVRIALLDALLKSAGKVLLGQRIGPLRKLIRHQNQKIATLAIANLGAWQLKGAEKDLLSILIDPKTAFSPKPPPSLGQLRGGEGKKALLDLAAGKPDERYFAIFGILVTSAEEAAELAAGLLFKIWKAVRGLDSSLQPKIQRKRVLAKARRKNDRSVKEKVAEYHCKAVSFPVNSNDCSAPHCPNH